MPCYDDTRRIRLFFQCNNELHSVAAFGGNQFFAFVVCAKGTIIPFRIVRVERTFLQNQSRVIFALSVLYIEREGERGKKKREKNEKERDIARGRERDKRDKRRKLLLERTTYLGAADW